jgi:D-hydroxyproline dehydrogenase subunit beta
MTAESFDCVIVGAGIVGAACAATLAQRKMRVALVERNSVGLGATAAGMGHIVVMDDSDAQFLLTQYSQQLWHALANKLPAAAEYEQCGTVWIAADEEELAEIERKRTFYTARGVATDVLTAKQLEAAEPELRKGLSGGLLVPSDGVLYAPAAARYLTQFAVMQGAEIINGEVIRMGSGVAELKDGRRLRSPRLVNAAGEHSAILTPGIPVRKRKGHLAITDRYPGFVRHQLVELGYLKSAHSTMEDSVAFNVQSRRTGQALIGSSRQFNESSGVDFQILSRMLARAAEYMPALAVASIVRVWTGLRAATPDKLPLIGPWTEDQTVFLATGHEGLGITTSLATAELLASCLDGKSPQIPLDPYLPARVNRMAHA